LKSGAAIEEIDIIDLRKHLSEIAENIDITFVYENLTKGSINHLNAFVTTLSKRSINFLMLNTIAH